jgi:sarcosine oxidase, subunit beta
MESADILIIGGGIVGCSTAMNLAQRGQSVILLERDVAGGQASGVNAGGVRRLLRDPREIPLSLASHELWHQMESLVGSDCGFQSCGQLALAENDAEMKALEERVNLLKSLGYSHEKLVDKKKLGEIVPNVAAHCVGGLYCPEDGSAEPYKTTRAFFNKAKQLGVQLLEHHPVSAIEQTARQWVAVVDDKRFSAPVIVNAAGAWGVHFTEMVGDYAPLYKKVSVMTVTARVARFLDPVVLLEGRKLSLKQMANGTVLIGGGHDGKFDKETEKTSILFSELKVMAQIVTDIFPFLKPVPIIRHWPGIIGRLPDNIPVIGPSQNATDCYHAFGFSGHGFQLGPIMGQILSEIILDGRPSISIDSFLVDRFTTAKN